MLVTPGPLRGGGVDALRDKTRAPGKAPVADEKAAAVVAMTLTPPPQEAIHWTTPWSRMCSRPTARWRGGGGEDDLQYAVLP